MSKSAEMVINEFYKGNGNVILPIDVVKIANAHGIKIYRATFREHLKNDVFGFIEKNNGITSIYVNAENSLTRRRFTVAHELGHYFLHHDDGQELNYLDLRSTKSTIEETEANRFAAELLMPEEQVRNEYSNLLFPTVDALARKFQVSKQAMKYRLLNLGLSAIDT